jgi:hypothetical protein
MSASARGWLAIALISKTNEHRSIRWLACRYVSMAAGCNRYARGHSFSCRDPHVFSMGTNLVVSLDQRLYPLSTDALASILNQNALRSRDFTVG